MRPFAYRLGVWREVWILQSRLSSAPQGRVVMVQGTASHVGKSVLTTALCRIFRQDGYRVAPFKAQNMSNNSFVTPSGGELGRAQAVQAEACGIEPVVEMNPILLKPEADHSSQVVLLGKPMARASARYFATAKPMLWEAVATSLDTLRAQFDVVVIEGAGSPAEINLKQNEIVNMRVALHSGAPVLLTGDIDRGGVFASLVGTMEILDPHERDAVGAFIINKFRGDVSLLEPGLVWLEERTGKPVLGVVPYYRDIEIAEEDSVSLERREQLKSQTGYALDIAVMGFPHISNFDDFDPLRREPGVRLRYVESRDSIGEPDLIILPGAKTTMADLFWLRERGFATEIKRQADAGTPVIGICGGYQMLGRLILDPSGVESPNTEAEGLGLLPVDTVFAPAKETHRVSGVVASDTGLLAQAGSAAVDGYEIHMGSSIPTSEAARPFRISRAGQPAADDGAISANGRVLGTYVHGLFNSYGLRRALLEQLAGWKGVELPPPSGTDGQLSRDGEYDKLAQTVRSSLDMELLYRLTGLEAPEIE